MLNLSSLIDFFFRTHWTLNIQKYKSCLSFCFCFIFYLFIYFFSIFGLFCPHWRITWDDDMKSVLCLGLAVFLGSVENLLKCFLSKNGFIWVIPSNRLGKKFWVWLRLQIEVCVCSDFARFIDFFLFFSHASVLLPCFLFISAHQRLSCLA